MTMHSEIIYKTETGEWRRLNGCDFPNAGGWSSPDEYVKERGKILYRGLRAVKYLNGLEFDNYADTRQRVWFS